MDNSGRTAVEDMSRDVRKPSSGFPTRSDTNRTVKPQKMVRSMKFQNKEVNELYYVAKTKGPMSCAVTAQLIRIFVFAYAKIRFSHDADHISRPCLHKRMARKHG